MDKSFVEKVNGSLKLKGFRSSKVRNQILKILLHENSPLSIAELRDELAERNLEPNKSTVYREIETLLENKFLQRVTLLDEQQRYCIAEEGHHHHLVCKNCGKILGVDMDDDVTALEERLQKETGFQIQEHTLEFFGLCADCQAVRETL